MLKLTTTCFQELNVCKYLGVIIDDKSIWKAHITLVKKQVSKVSGIICKFRHYIPFRSVKTVYYSIVYSHLRYAITSWGSSSFSTLSTLNQGRSQDFSKGGAEVMEAKALKKKNCL